MKYSTFTPTSVGAKVAVSVAGESVIVGASGRVGDGPGVAVVGG
jgi:hypothetical protein